MSSHGFRSGVAALVLSLVVFSSAAHALTPTPAAGDVFREYSWRPKGHFVVLDDKLAPVTISGDVDLVDATRAELVVEIANAHLGYPDLSVAMNDHDARPIAFPERGPHAPSPALWFFHWYPTIAVPLTELAKTNRLQFRIGAQLPANRTHPKWTPVYGATLRVYYDPARKPHALGRITTPLPNAKLPDVASITVDATGPRAVSRIDVVARYEGPNPEGDGVWDQWHYTIEKGEVRHHVGTVTKPGARLDWDTRWLPDQPRPIELAARVVDDAGVVTVTPAVGGLTLARAGVSVELVKPTDVPPAFTNCQYGLFVYQGPRSETLELRGDPARAIDARIVFSGWNAPAWRRFSFNGTLIDELVVPHGDADGNRSFLEHPLRPLSALARGRNALATVPGPARQMDVHWPGVALLVRYAVPDATVTAPAPPAPAFRNALGMSFVRVAPGAFTLGSPDAEPGHMWEERAIPAKLTRPFFVSTTEVTQGQFEAIMGRNPSHVQGAELPVTQVTWPEAVEFCSRLGKRDGKHRYRLPTEAEWEYAARAGTTTAFFVGPKLASWQANVDGRHDASGWSRGGPTRVATFAPNAWGLYDVAGNVWEWTTDWYGEYPKLTLSDPPVANPTGATETSRFEIARVLRGGAWDTDPEQSRSATRWRVAPDTRLPSIGFRVVAEDAR